MAPMKPSTDLDVKARVSGVVRFANLSAADADRDIAEVEAMTVMVEGRKRAARADLRRAPT